MNIFSNECRTCGEIQDCKQNKISIFSHLTEMESTFVISDVLNSNCDLNIYHDDLFPKFICEKCLGHVNSFVIFRKQCHSIDLQFRKTIDLLKLKPNQTNTANDLTMFTIDKLNTDLECTGYNRGLQEFKEEPPFMIDDTFVEEVAYVEKNPCADGNFVKLSNVMDLHLINSPIETNIKTDVNIKAENKTESEECDEQFIIITEDNLENTIKIKKQAAVSDDTDLPLIAQKHVPKLKTDFLTTIKGIESRFAGANVNIDVHYRCTICQYNFKDSLEFVKHLETHPIEQQRKIRRRFSQLCAKRIAYAINKKTIGNESSRDNLINSLLNIPDDSNGIHFVPNNDNAQMHNNKYMPTTTMLPVAHYQEKIPAPPNYKRKTYFLKCKYCYKQKIIKFTSYRCQDCINKPPLCPGECFKHWHILTVNSNSNKELE